jgi:hemolysin III
MRGVVSVVGGAGDQVVVQATDEKFNTASHLVAAIFALLGTSWLVTDASVAGQVWHIVTFAIYGVTLVGLFLASTFFHGLQVSAAKRQVLRSIDYSFIFLLIAGTFTPICLALIGTTFAWCVCGTVWTVGIAGLVLRVSRPDLPIWVTSTLYAGMGALGFALLWPLYVTTGLGGVALVAGGGVLYYIGTVIFSLERPNPLPGRFGHHEIWHLFVIGGAAAHFAFMAVYIKPLIG